MDAGAAGASAAEPTIDPSVRWAAPAPGDLLWMEDGACAVLFDRRSRQTHVLSPAARRALTLLMGGPLSADELCRRMAEPATDDGGEGAAPEPALVAELLGTFDSLGLVEPAGL